MGSGFGSYEIARSGMYVNERGLFVTGHNISNVNTPGFTRQQSISKTSYYIGNNSNMQYGLGASIEQTRQIRHTFLDNTFRREAQELGRWNPIKNTYSEIQNIIGEPLNPGIQSNLNQFWDSWQELSKEPESLTIRALVRQRGESFSDYVNHMGKQFKSLLNNLDNQMSDKIKSVNDITSNIAKLNEQIVSVESSNDRANDLRDQRNNLLDDLSSLINIDVTEQSNGSVNVVSNGYALVTGKQTTKLLNGDPNKAQAHPTPFLDYKVNGQYMELIPKSGELKGIIESRNKLDDTVSQLNKLIDTIVGEVNKAHLDGKNISSPTNDGVVFFTFKVSPDNGLMEVSINNEIKSDLNKITTGGNLSEGKGDNKGALQIANLRNKTCAALGDVSIDDFYQQKVVLEVGNKGREAKTFLDGQLNLTQSIDNQRKSISAVSMDEEMSAMLKYQFAYSGASKAFNTIDEMINTIVNRMGLVGR